MKESPQIPTKETQPSDQWYLDIPMQETNCKTLNGIPVEVARLSIFHGTGMATGTNGVNIDFITVDQDKFPAGGYMIKNGEFYSFDGVSKSNNPNSLIAPIIDKFEKHFKENPDTLEKINEKLKNPLK